ncbi:MAG TPA: molybdenum cofactor guanylyltransferase [Acidimicrobiales bacterium]
MSGPGGPPHRTTRPGAGGALRTDTERTDAERTDATSVRPGGAGEVVPGVAPFAAAVLCGGASRRMGRDKALVEVGGRPFAVRVADALRRAGATEVVAVGGDRAALTALGLPFVPDESPGLGPVGGIVSALRRAVGDLVLVVGCDLVDPSPRAMAATVRALAADATADLAVPLLDGERQWVHAAWRRSCLPALGRQLQGGVRAVHRAVAGAGLAVVDVVGIAPGALADADTPDDLPPG